jgi:hypothetical protein
MTATETQPELDWPELTDAERAAIEDETAVMTAAHELDPETDDYPDLTPAHRLCECGTCGRLLLAANLPGERPRGFRVTGHDRLPPTPYRWVARRGRRVAECCGCYVAERRANRGRAG